MPDFGSALYLGMRHPSALLGRWEALTLGRPAAAGEPPGAPALAAALARLVGCPAGTLLHSTLHLFWDLLRMLSAERIVLLVDDHSYPIARWCAGCAAANGTPLELFAHASVGSVARMARRWAEDGRRPVILADGYFPGADTAPPLRAYAAIARSLNGLLVLDDTQALGLFGAAPSRGAPYGHGGGGSARRHGLAGAHVVIGASLAKGFGTPLAVLCASAALVRRFERESETRTHSSPPSVASVRAGLHALDLNDRHGEALRRRLWCTVAHWRSGLARHAIDAHGGSFPVQTLALAPGIDGEHLHACLRGEGVDTVLQRVRERSTVSFLFTADHTHAQIELAVAVLAACLRKQRASAYGDFGAHGADSAHGAGQSLGAQGDHGAYGYHDDLRDQGAHVRQVGLEAL
jgi:8-amino-7-oxononanoate synthase